MVFLESVQYEKGRLECVEHFWFWELPLDRPGSHCFFSGKTHSRAVRLETAAVFGMRIERRLGRGVRLGMALLDGLGGFYRLEAPDTAKGRGGRAKTWHAGA